MNTPFLDTARRVIRCESEALLLLADSLDDRFRAAVDLMRNCQGPVLGPGIGNSGHTGNQTAAPPPSPRPPAPLAHARGTSRYLTATTCPLRCEGNLGGSPAKWCGPDKDGFKDIGKQVAANATKDKLKEKFGIDGEGDTTEEVLKDAAQKKAKEEVNKQLQDGLKKLFN